jgi:hypothetical protein
MVADSFTRRTVMSFLKGVGRFAAMAGAVALASTMVVLPARAQTSESGFHYPSSWVELQRMKPMEVMHMMDADRKGYVTKEEFLKFQEEVFNKMDKDKTGKITKEQWMGQKSKKGSTKKEE